jgi:hypothetical protein
LSGIIGAAQGGRAKRKIYMPFTDDSHDAIESVGELIRLQCEK